VFVQLKELRSNPLRDFAIDPVDKAKVSELKQSIEEDGYWGGVVCRNVNNHIEIVAGEHRVQAAIAAGIRKADMFVADIDDATAIRIYARENATQRGNSGTAQTGTVAAAVKFLAKGLLTGSPEIRRSSPEALGNLQSDKGLGENLITDFLKGVPGINKNTVMQQLANLKSSGHYARLIDEVRQQIEKENAEALKALAKAEKEKEEAEERAAAAEVKRKEAAALAKAAREEKDRKHAEYERQKAEEEAKLASKRAAEAEREMQQFDKLRTTRDAATKAATVAGGRQRTFDVTGVQKYLSVDSHVQTFRKLVESEALRQYLPVNKQAELARHLKELAIKENNGELSSAFIRAHVANMVMQVGSVARQIDKDQERILKQQNLLNRWDIALDNFSRNARGLRAAADDLVEIAKEKEAKNIELPLSREFRMGMEGVISSLNKMGQKLGLKI
jgi:hypothetical protein